MLTHLEITHFVVVEHAIITLPAGMTVITGETGSGKSIILHAIQLILGAKADPSWIQPGANTARIVAHLDLQAHTAAKEWLSSQGFPLTSPCVIQRILVREGRARITLNGHPITLPQLRRFSELFIQLHGQHAHQALLRSHEQRRLLDAFARNTATRHAVETAYRHWLHCIEKKEARQAQHHRIADLALLQYQVEELATLDLLPGEWESLHKTHAAMTEHAGRREAHTALTQLLTDLPWNAIFHAQKPLSDLNVDTLLRQAQLYVEEAITTLRTYPLVEPDPQQLALIEQRLSVIYHVARKHRVAPEYLPQHYQHLLERLQESTDWEDQCAALDAAIEAAYTAYHTAAATLTDTRDIASTALAAAITDRMGTLGFTDGICEIRLIPSETHTPSPAGQESVEYWISMNPDHALQPLSKIASGGELSRISLAIQIITADAVCTPTLVFDEVDTGIGGKTGAMVGRALRDLSQHAQIICVTHLPQIAALADTHFVVDKQRIEGKTLTQVRLLEEPARIEELARMLGGVDITPQARAHAKALMGELTPQT